MGMENLSPWLMGAEAAGTLALGTWDLIKARKLQQGLGPRPVYRYDQAIAANQGQLALAQGEAPGLAQQMQGVNQTLANTTQSIANMAPSGAAGLGALVQAGAGTQQSVADLLANAAQQKLGLQQNYLQGKAGLQQYADTAFQVNQLDPYVQKQNEIAALKQAGMQNIGNAVSGAKDIGLAASEQSSMIDAFYGTLTDEQKKDFQKRYPKYKPKS